MCGCLLLSNLHTCMHLSMCTLYLVLPSRTEPDACCAGRLDDISPIRAPGSFPPNSATRRVSMQKALPQAIGLLQMIKYHDLSRWESWCQGARALLAASVSSQ